MNNKIFANEIDPAIHGVSPLLCAVCQDNPDPNDDEVRTDDPYCGECHKNNHNKFVGDPTKQVTLDKKNKIKSVVQDDFS